MQSVFYHRRHHHQYSRKGGGMWIYFLEILIIKIYAEISLQFRTMKALNICEY